MKKILLVLCICLFAAQAQAEYLKDPIITSPQAVWTDARSYSTLDAAFTAVSAGGLLVISSNSTLTANATLATDSTLLFLGDGHLTIASGIVLTVNGCIQGPERELFNGTGSLSGTPANKFVYSAWTAGTVSQLWTVTELSQVLFLYGAPGEHLVTNATGNGYEWAQNSGFLLNAFLAANATANATSFYWCDTSLGGFTILLPAAPSDNDEIGFGDAYGAFNSTNPLTVSGNGKLINGQTTWDLDIPWMTVRMRYVLGLDTWRIEGTPAY
jgi:hypothetical protein